MACETYIECEDNKGLSAEDLFKKLVLVDSNGCPVLNVNAVLEGDINANLEDLEVLVAATNTALASLNTDLGNTDDAAASSDTGTFSLISLFKRLLSKLTTGIFVTGKISTIIENEFTRPADTAAYAANDVINNATSSATNQSLTDVATENEGSGYMTVVLETDSTAVTPTIRVHFYDAAPATAKNDNAAWTLVYADKSKYLGYIDMPPLNGGVAIAQFKSYKAASASRALYYELQTLSAFTPVSASKYNLRVIPDQNNA